MTGPTENANGRPLRNLSARQKQVIEMLAAGYSVDEAAQLVGVPPALIRKWKRTDLRFRNALVGRKADPQPPVVDLFDLMDRWLRIGEPEQPWAAEDKQGGGLDGRDD
jgi:hypothetical protein